MVYESRYFDLVTSEHFKSPKSTVVYVFPSGHPTGPGVEETTL